MKLANMDEINRIIHGLYPEAHDIRHIEHGYENHIVVIDDNYVVRFPRSAAVWARTALERFVLLQLDLPIVPKVLQYSTDPPYIVQTFLPGNHMSENDFREFPVSTQQDIGRQIAAFAYKLHSTITVDEF